MPRLDDWIAGYRSAWVERDPEAAASLFTSESTYRANIFEEPYRGRDRVRSTGPR